MDIIEHEERLEGAGFNREQAREILRVVTSGDAIAMSRANGQDMELRLTTRMDGLEDRFTSRMDRLEDKLTSRMDAMEGRFEALGSKLDSIQQKLIATAWTVGGVAVGILTAIRYFS